MEHLRRFGYLFLVFAVWGCLSPIQTLQLEEDMREIGIHLERDGEAASCLLLDASQWTHDCHSCLVSHLGASVGVVLQGTSFSNLLRKGNRVPFRHAEAVARRLVSPNKRSPPVV